MVNKILATGILFDLDGTLIETTEAVELHWRALCKKHNVDTEELLKHSNGLQSIAILTRFFPKEVANQMTIAELDKVTLADMRGVHVIDGARELINKLPASRWGIVTSGSELMASTRLNQMQLPIPECFFPAERVTKSKPDPEGYTKAARFLGLDPHDCIVFEDAPAGIQAGINAGSTVIGVVSVHTSEQKLLELGASFCINSFNDLDISMEKGMISVALKNKKVLG